MQVISYLLPLLYAKGDKYLDFFLFLPGRKDYSRIRIFLFFLSFFIFLRVYPASTPASSSPAFEKKFFFSYLGGHELPPP